MADYYPLIAKAVTGLEKSTGETRRALYDRARTALLAQLRGVEPALSEADITRERLALEEAIRKVEGEIAFPRTADAARRLRGEPPASRPDGRLDAPDQPQDFVEQSGYGDEAEAEEVRPAIPLSAAAATARAPDSEVRQTERWSAGGPSLSDNGLRSFRESIGEAGAGEEGAVRTYPADRDVRRFEQSPNQWTADDHAGVDQGRDLRGQDLRGQDLERPLPRLSSRDVVRPPIPLTDQDEGRGRALQSFPRVARPEQRTQAPARAAPERPLTSGWSAPRNTNRIVAIAVMCLLVAGIASVAFWFGDDIMSSMRGTSSRADLAAPADASHGKIAERAPSLGETAPTAQKVVLYEEDPSNPNGTQYVGSAIWRTERVPPAPGQKPEVTIRGEIEIPEQKVSVRLSLRRNDDKQLPASHTVEIMFTLPPDFAHGGIQSIPGIMVKQGETNRGIALNGVAVKVTNNYFLVGLSSADAEMQRNVQLLKERSWFDIPIVYADGKRALIAIEKGVPGERAFGEAFAAWEQP